MSPRESSEYPAATRRGSPRLWFALLGGPAAWIVALVGSYFAVHEVCRTHSILAPRLVSIITLGVAIAAALSARAIWSGAERRSGSGDSIALERTRFLAQLGVLSGTVFSLIILLQIVATLLLPGCRDRPRTPVSPDVVVPTASLDRV